MSIFKKLFKRTTALDIVGKMNLKPLDSSSAIAKTKETLMANLFFGVFEDLAKDSDPDYRSWITVSNRHQFSATGAFLHRRDINALLFTLENYPGNKVLATSGLSEEMKQDDRDRVRKALDARLVAQGYRLRELLEVDLDTLDITDEKLYFAMYAQLFFILHTFMFNIPDLTYITRNLALAILNCVAVLRKTKAARLAPVIGPHFEELVRCIIECTFPLSLNTFNELRNSVPNSIRSRMHQINYKVKKLNTESYVSPLERRKQLDGRV